MTPTASNPSRFFSLLENVELEGSSAVMTAIAFLVTYISFGMGLSGEKQDPLEG